MAERSWKVGHLRRATGIFDVKIHPKSRIETEREFEWVYETGLPEADDGIALHKGHQRWIVPHKHVPRYIRQDL